LGVSPGEVIVSIGKQIQKTPYLSG
jgi:hypothetical protein